MSQRKIKTFLDVKTKAELIKRIKSGADKDELLKEYNIGETSYYKLMRNESEIMKILKKPENKHRILFKKMKNEYLDDAVIKWFQQARDRGDPINGRIIREKAKVLNKKLHGSPDFKASVGWLSKFKKRYNIRYNEMKEEQPLLNDLESIEDFSTYLKEKIVNEKLHLENVYNVDESGIYWRSLATRILPQKVNHEMPENNDRGSRITAVFCSNARGNKQMPLLIIGQSSESTCLKNEVSKVKNQSCLTELLSLGVIYTNHENAWMDQTIFKNWFEEIFIPQALDFQQESGIKGKILLVLDSAPCHPPLAELNTVNKDIEVIHLPPNLTAQFQPMAQGPITFTKKYYKTKLLHNLIYADTSGGGVEEYLKNFNYRDCFYFLKHAWNFLEDSTLRKAWKHFLGDFYQPVDNPRPKRPSNVNRSQLTVNGLEIVDIQDSKEKTVKVEFPRHIGPVLSGILNGRNFRIENGEKVCRDWFEAEETDSSWEPLSDEEIIHFVINNSEEEKKGDQVPATDSEGSSDTVFNTKEVSASKAYESLKIVKMWIRQKTSQLLLNKLTLEQVESMINQEINNSSDKDCSLVDIMN